jgi:hypothetical protein
MQTPSALLPHAAQFEILRRPTPLFARYARSAAPAVSGWQIRLPRWDRGQPALSEAEGSRPPFSREPRSAPGAGENDAACQVTWEPVLGIVVADSIDEDLFLNGAVADTGDQPKLSNDEVLVSVDRDILLVDEDIFVNVEDADVMNGQNLSIDDDAVVVNGQNLSIDDDVHVIDDDPDVIVDDTDVIND